MTEPDPTAVESPAAARPAGVVTFRVALGGVAFLVICTLIVIGVTLNRGFDWSDEGFSYVMIASNRAAVGEFWGFQHLLHPIFELFGGNILAFRILRLIGYIALSIALTAVAWLALDTLGRRYRWWSWAMVLLVAQVGTFAAWSYPPRNLGYNELSAWLTQLGGALVILLFVLGRATSLEKGRRRLEWVLWGAVGFLLASLVFAKITAALVLGALALVAALLVARRRWLRLGVIALGGLIALGAMLLVQVPVATYLGSMAQLLMDPAARAASGYSVSDLLRVYLASASLTVGVLAAPTILTALGLGAAVVSEPASVPPRTRTLPPAIENAAVLLAVVLALMVMAFPVFPSAGGLWDALGVGVAYLLVAAVVGFALVVPRTIEPGLLAGRRSTLLIAALVLFTLVPLVSGVGTNNPLMGQVVYSATLWAVGAGLALVIVWERASGAWIVLRTVPLMLIVAIVAAGVFAVSEDVRIHPYRTALYMSQKTPTSMGAFSGLRLTPEEVSMLEWLDEEGERLDAEGVPAVSIAPPGALLAFNASGWTNPWPAPDWAASIARSCADGAPDELYVLQSADQVEGTPNHDRLVAGLDSCDISFPDDFERVSNHPSDQPTYDVTIWQLSD